MFRWFKRKREEKAIVYCLERDIDFTFLDFSALDYWVKFRARTPYGDVVAKVKYLTAQQMGSLIFGFRQPYSRLQALGAKFHFNPIRRPAYDTCPKCRGQCHPYHSSGWCDLCEGRGIVRMVVRDRWLNTQKEEESHGEV